MPLSPNLLGLSENAHLPFDVLTALSKAEGLRYPHPSSLRRTFMYASFLGISEALHLDIFHQPQRSRFFDSFAFVRGLRMKVIVRFVTGPPSARIPCWGPLAKLPPKFLPPFVGC